MSKLGPESIDFFNEENEVLYDPYTSFLVASAYVEIPWPEWSDADLNAETWEIGRGSGIKKEVSLSNNFFEDVAPPKLPPPLGKSVVSWLRPDEVFPDADLVVYDPSKNDFFLSVPSPAAACDFYRALNEHLRILQLYALMYGFPVELESPNFYANTQGEVWRPWHHIYALTKAGKGQTHKPLYCPYGKYVVRLYYMGSWRKFVVDDKIPCDKNGNCMLPVTQIPGELWPIILTKALLKIMTLTPTKHFRAMDFPLYKLLTGWTHTNFTTKNKTIEQVWRRLCMLLPRFELPEEEVNGDHYSIATATKNRTQKESRQIIDKKGPLSERYCFLLAVLENLPAEKNLLKTYQVGVIMTRDRPLGRVDKRPGTKPWKRIRWIYWAKERDLWTDELTLPAYRRLQYITIEDGLVRFLAPDPKQEFVMYDVQSEEKVLESELSKNEFGMLNPEQWCDYLKFYNYLQRVEVYFKPSAFMINIRISCFPPDTTPENPPEKLSLDKQPQKSSSNDIFYPPVLKPTCNEPLYLFCESVTGIFICFSLWVCPKDVKASVGYLEEDHPQVVKVSHGSLIIEQYNWRNIVQGEIIGLIKTVGSSSFFLTLKPGRYLFKLWLDSDSPYTIHVSSNVNTVIHKSPKIRFHMSKESEHISNYVVNVSNAFIALTQKFGKPDLPAALRDFYTAIRPGNEGGLNYLRRLDSFIETFLNCIMQALKDSDAEFLPEELKLMCAALRSLFLNLNIQCDSPSPFQDGAKKTNNRKTLPLISVKSFFEVITYPWSDENIEQIIKIQKVFRGYRVRLLKKCQTPARKEFKIYIEQLKKICDTLFVPPNRELEGGMLLRRIVLTRPDLLTTFKFHDQFANVLHLEEYTGKIPNVDPFAWVPMARFIVATHSEEPVLAAFYFSCNLERYAIQGFDNDTNKEIFRLTNVITPHYFRNNVRGYTIFAFGWNEASIKTVNWRLELVKIKHFGGIHLCNMLFDSTCLPYAMPSLEMVELKNLYVPNSKNRICRCFIKIQKRSLLTLRFATSYSQVHFVIKISLDNHGSNSESDRDVIANITSTTGAVLVASLVLDFVENSCSGEDCDPDTTVYFLEAFVLNKSWPLTKQEWGVVEPIRVSGEPGKVDFLTEHVQARKSESGSRRRISRMSKRSTAEPRSPDSPYWMVQVVNDLGGSEHGEWVVVEEDKSSIETLKAMKASWEEKDPGRRKRGGELRVEFLTGIFLEKKYLSGEGEEGNVEEDKEKINEEVQSMLHRMSSFSYLTTDMSQMRYLKSPRILPVVPLSQLLYRYSNRFRNRTVTTEVTQSSDVDSESSRSIAYTSKEIGEEIKEFFNQCLHFRNVLNDHINEELKLSNLLMEEAYASRSKVIERMLR